MLSSPYGAPVPAPEPELVGTADAARSLGVSRRTLVRYVERGLLRPTVTLPSGHYRWSLADLQRQLAELRDRGDE